MTCPRHPDARLITATFAGATVPVLACPECDHWERLVRGQRKLPGLQPGRQSRRTHIAEEVAQEAVVRMLRADGYTVLVTSRRRKRVRCEACGRWQWPAGGDGVDRGTPDLLISRDGDSDTAWPNGAWLGLEIKGSDTPLSAEQADLAADGRVAILRAAESLDATVREAQGLVAAFAARIASGCP